MTELQPFIMGIVVLVVMGIILIVTYKLCCVVYYFRLSGIAGASTVGCAGKWLDLQLLVLKQTAGMDCLLKV